MYGKSANSVPGQSFRAVYLEYVIGRCFRWPFFRGFLQRYFREALSRDICGRCLRAVFSGDVFASVIEAWLPGKGSRNCFLKVVSESAPPEKRFAGMPLATASGTSFHKASSGNVSGACFLEGISKKRTGIMRDLQARCGRNTKSGNITGRR